MPFNVFTDSYYYVLVGFFEFGTIALMAFTIWRLVVKLLLNPVRDIFGSWMKIVKPK